jgi:hypothetical protein
MRDPRECGYSRSRPVPAAASPAPAPRLTLTLSVPSLAEGEAEGGSGGGGVAADDGEEAGAEGVRGAAGWIHRSHANKS